MIAQPETETPAIKAWQRVVTISAVVIALTLIAISLVIGAIIPPIIGFAIAFIVIAGLLWRFGGGRRWPWVVVGILTVLAILGDAEFLIYDLSHPEEWGLFIPNVVMVGAILLIAVGAVVIGTRRGFGPRAALLVVGAMVGVATVFSVGSAITLDRHEQQSGDTLFVAEAFKFPDRFELNSGGQWVFLDNRDRVRHTFVIDALDLKVDMPGSTGRRAQLDIAPGEYEFYCDVPGHEEEMRGTLIVAGGQAGR